MIITTTKTYTVEFLVQSPDGGSDFEFMSVDSVLFVSYKCSICGQHYTSHSLLQDHLRIHDVGRKGASDDNFDLSLIKESTYLQSICVTLGSNVGEGGHGKALGNIYPEETAHTESSSLNEHGDTVSIIAVTTEDDSEEIDDVVGVTMVTSSDRHDRASDDLVKELDQGITPKKKQISVPDCVHTPHKASDTPSQTCQNTVRDSVIPEESSARSDGADFDEPVELSTGEEKEQGVEVEHKYAKLTQAHNDHDNFSEKQFLKPGHMCDQLKSGGPRVDKPHKCPKCEKTYKQERNFTNHLKTHAADKPLTEMKIAIQHVQDTRKSLPHICTVCNNSFAKLQQLHAHQITHQTERQFKCVQCDKTFKRKCDLSVHLKEHKLEKQKHGSLETHKHKTEKLFQCNECDRQFRRQSNLTRHRFSHGKQPIKPENVKYPLKVHTCSYCDKVFNTLSGLKKHKRVHTGEKPYHCTVCPRRFSHSYSLSLHMKYHSGEKPHQCPECGKCFVQKGYFNSHVKSHSGEPTCQCSVCGQMFKWAVSLKVHMRSHTGEKPYRCTQCGQCFKSAGQYRLHVRTHTGDKPFICEVCKKAFVSSSKLCRHKKIHNKKKTPYCPITRYKCQNCDAVHDTEEELLGHQEDHPSSYMIVVNL